MAERALSTCEQCGQEDDHPKVHIGAITKHHDCLSAAEERALRDSAQEKDSGPKASAIIDACKKGTRGEKLVALIEGGKLPQAEGLYAQEVSDNG
jgi:hypothetical protein